MGRTKLAAYVLFWILMTGSAVQAGSVEKGLDKAGDGVKKGVDVSAGGVKKAVDVTGGGVKKGVKESKGGVDKAVDVTGGGVKKGVKESKGGVDKAVDVTGGGVKKGVKESKGGVDKAVDVTGGGLKKGVKESKGGIDKAVDVTGGGVKKGWKETDGGVKRAGKRPTAVSKRAGKRPMAASKRAGKKQTVEYTRVLRAPRTSSKRCSNVGFMRTSRPISTLLAVCLAAVSLAAPTSAAESHSSSASTSGSVTAWRAALVEGRRRLEHRDLTGAEACFRQAVTDAKRGGASTDDTVSCMESLADCLQQEDITEDSYPLYKKSLHRLEKAHGKESVILVPTLGYLGNISMGEGDYAKATTLYQRAVTILEKAGDANSFVYADFEHRLGRSFAKQNLPREAEKFYRTSLNVMMTHCDLPSADPLNETLADYIDTYRKTTDPGVVRTSSVQKELLRDDPKALGNGKGVATAAFTTEVSIRLADQANDRATGKSPPLQNTETSPSPTQAPIPSGSSTSINVTGPLDDFAAGQQIGKQRIDFYERMVAVDIQSLGANHPSVARDLTSLAAVYLEQNDFGNAKPLLQRAFKIYQTTYGDNAQLTEKMRTLVKLVSEEQRAVESGAPPSNEYLSQLPIIPVTAQTAEVALRLNYLALLCLSYGRLEDAQNIYAWALAATARAAGDRSMLAACCLNDYARALRGTNQAARAQEFENDAVAIVRDNLVKKAAASVP